MSERDGLQQMQRELFLSVLMPTKPSVAMARRMAQAMREIRVSAGHVLYDKGDASESSYFIAEGTIVLDDEGDDPLSYGVSDIVGVVDLNLDRPRSRRAVATTDTVLLELRYEDWLEAQEDNLEWSAATRRVISQIVHRSILESAVGLAPQPAQELPRVFEGTVVERIVAMHGSTYFERAGVQALAALAHRATVIDFARDEALALQADVLYLVAVGAVRLQREEPAIQLQFGRGDVLLGGGAFSGALAQYQAHGVTSGKLLALRFADLDDVIEDHFQLSRSLMRGISLDREHWTTVRRKRASEMPPTL